MKYRESWDLSTIPDHKLLSEFNRRRGSRNKKKDVDPAERARLDKIAEKMRILRKARKEQI